MSVSLLLKWVERQTQFDLAFAKMDLEGIEDALKAGADIRKYRSFYNFLDEYVWFWNEDEYPKTVEDKQKSSLLHQKIARLLIAAGVDPASYLSYLPIAAAMSVGRYYDGFDEYGPSRALLNPTLVYFLTEIGAYPNFVAGDMTTALDWFVESTLVRPRGLYAHVKPQSMPGYPDPEIAEHLRSYGCKRITELSETEIKACRYLYNCLQEELSAFNEGVRLRQAVNYQLGSDELLFCLEFACAKYYTSGQSEEMEAVLTLCQQNPYIQTAPADFAEGFKRQLKNLKYTGPQHPERAARIVQQLRPFVHPIQITVTPNYGPPQSNVDAVLKENLSDWVAPLNAWGDFTFDELQRTGRLVPYRPERNQYVYYLDGL